MEVHRPDGKSGSFFGFDCDAADVGPMNSSEGFDMRLQGFDLSGVDAEGLCGVSLHLVDCDLTAARLVGADLRGARFVRVCMPGADLRDADLTGAVFEDCDVRWVDWRGATGLARGAPASRVRAGDQRGWG